jgi:hypothetical protein
MDSSLQQVVVIRRTKSTRAPPNTPRRAGARHREQRAGSGRFLTGFGLTLFPAKTIDRPDRNTLPEWLPGPSQLAVPPGSMRAQTVDWSPGSAPGWSLLASMLKDSPDAAGLRRSISTALASAGDPVQFVGHAETCLRLARQLVDRGALDVATRCRLGGLLHHCHVLQVVFFMDGPDLLTCLIQGLLEVAEFDWQQQTAARLAAALQILARIQAHDDDPEAIDAIRSMVAELTIELEDQKHQRVSDKLQCWGLKRSETDESLMDDRALRAFSRSFDMAALHPRFECVSEATLRVVSFAPILATFPADVVDMVSAMADRDRPALAVQLLGGHMLSRSHVDGSDDVFPILLRLCATLWQQVEADIGSRRALLRVAQHVRLLIDCGLVHEAQIDCSTDLLDKISLPSLDGRLKQLDDMASVCGILRAAASGGRVAGQQSEILRVAADVAAACPGGGREAIEREVLRCDEISTGRWHSTFLAYLADRLDRRSQIDDACMSLEATAFPFERQPSPDSSAAYWEAVSSFRGRSFTWKEHGDAFMAFAYARLDQSPEMEPTEVQQWFDIVCVDQRPKHSRDRVKLLALAMRAISRSKELLNGITMRDSLNRMASEPRTVNQAIDRCGVDAFQLCIELAAHKLITPESNTVQVLLKQMMSGEVFEGMTTSVLGRHMLDDLLVRVVADPELLERRPLCELLRALVTTESARPASRKLLEHPVLHSALVRPEKAITSAVLECLLLLPLQERQRRAKEIGFTPTKKLSLLFDRGQKFGKAALRWWLDEIGNTCEPRLRIAVVGAAMADNLGLPAPSALLNPNIAPLADNLLLLHELQPSTVLADRRGEVQHLVDIVRLTLRLIRDRPGETSQAFFRLFPPLNDPAEAESVVMWQGARAISSEGRAIKSKGEPGLFAFAALLTCMYLIDEQPLPVAENFEAASLARLMCAALWLDEGRGMRCRQQLAQLDRHAHRVEHWVLAPTWISSLRAELGEASDRMSG